VISTREVRELAGRLVTDELVVLPVRHHSPACALHVRDVIAQRRPSVVLVEGPRSFTPLIPLLTDPAAVMPLAIYTWYVRRAAGERPEERASAYFPFCDYSPELVALRDAAAAGIPARFIDLDFVEQALAERQSNEGQSDEGQRDEPPEEYDAGRSLLDERRFAHSRALQLLADRLGCRDHEDLWERLFETRRVDLDEHVARVAAYCRLARLDQTDADLRAEGTLQREAEMAFHVREALDRRQPGDGPVLVVVGGFHAIVLPDLLAAPPPRPAVARKTVQSEAALIRFTFDRLERLNGYAAGMTAPAWHQLLWEHVTAAAARPVTGPGEPRGRGGPGDLPRTAATLVALLDISRELRRKHQLPVPVPSVSAAYGQALQLAALRDREAPLRSDLVDAVTSCFVKGDADVEGRLVLSATRQVLTGDRVGVVPPGAGTPPLVADALARLRAQRLKVDAPERQTASLDIYRRPAHRTTSRMMHGLGLLGVPFAVRTAGPDFVQGRGLGRLQERWDYHWTPATDGALAEASLLGSTLPEAVAAKFGASLREHEQSAERRSAKAAVGLLAQACVLGLHDRVGRILALVRSGIAADAAFDEVAASATQLGLLWESREPLEARQLDRLPALIAATYARAIYLGRELQGQECEPRAVAGALLQLRELLVGEAGAGLDPELFWRMVDQLRERHDASLVRGAAAGVAYAAGRLDDDGLATAVHGHLAGTVPAAEAVAFLAGLLLTAREAAWQNPQLVARLDARLKAWDEETFVRHLPELRLAFATMTPVETDRIASSVAGLHGLTELGPLLVRDADEDDVRRHLELSARVAGLLGGDGLAAWGGA
jgi:hypothetical protein